MFASPGAIAIQIGPFAIRWYGLLIATAVLLGTALAHREALRRGQDPDRLLDVVVVGVLAGLLGGRLYYVLFNWGYYGKQPAKIVAVWEGGLAIHGAILGGIVAIALYGWLKRLPILTYLDIFAPPLALGQAIGRWGNFFNQEAFGRPTDLPWKLYIDPYHRPPQFQGYEYFHPTFLYESLWDLFIFAILFYVLRKRVEETPGALALWYLNLYSFGRFFIEGLRVDSLMLGRFRAAQVVSVLLFLVSAWTLLYLGRAREKAAVGGRKGQGVK